ncbi:MAG: S8 family serine peptidase [Alphaproteobacteria bacterium]
MNPKGLLAFPAMRRGLVVAAMLFALPLVLPIASVRAMADSSVLDYDREGRLGTLRDVEIHPGETHPGQTDPGKSGRNGAKPDVSGKDKPETGAEAPDPTTWYEPGEVVAANPPPEFEITAQAYGFRVLEKISLKNLGFEVWRLRIPDGLSVPEAISRLAERFPGLLVDANHRYQGQAGVARPGSLARALMGWNTQDSNCGEGIRIGMIDTPVDINHEALRGQKIEARSFIRPVRQPAPAEHGTAIAAMLVGKPDANGWGGLLPEAQLLAANIFAITDSGTQAADLVALLKAVDWLASEHVSVVNMSIAGADNRLMRFAISHAADRSMVMVAAVGNWGTADRPAYPAAYDQVIGVTAIDGNDKIYAYANRGAYVAFAAPGVEVWTAVPGGGKYQSGTSFAVPYLTSLLATEIASGAKPSSASLKELFSREAVDLGAPGKDDVFGWGLVKREPRCTGAGSAKIH